MAQYRRIDDLDNMHVRSLIFIKQLDFRVKLKAALDTSHLIYGGK